MLLISGSLKPSLRFYDDLGEISFFDGDGLP